MSNPDAMDIDTTPQTKTKPTTKTLTLTTSTLKHPPFAYAHLTLAPTPTPENQPQPTALDALQARSYFTTALRQFLGDTGAAIPLDILLVRDASVWVRMPQPDLAAFAAAVTAFSGLGGSAGGTMLLQLKSCGDWLGSLLGREEEGGLWVS